MYKLKEKDFTKIESFAYSWIVKNRYKLIGFILFSIFFMSLKSLPYLNLFVGDTSIVFFLVATFIVIFNISLKKVIIFSFILLFFIFTLIIMGEVENAELLGDNMYGFLLLSTILHLLKSKEE